MKITTTLIIVIICLLVTVGILFKSNKSNKNDYIRWKNNYEEIKKDNNVINKTFREFKETTTETQDSLLKLLDIKPKQVVKIVEIKTYYKVTDTILIPISETDSILEDMFSLKKYTLSFSKKTDCYGIEGFIKTNDNTSELNLTTVENNNELTYVVYWKRRRYYLLGFIPTSFLGKKVTTLKTESKCGNTEISEINIIKQK
jgi:hypothetical protein